MSTLKHDEIRKAVRETYGKIAQTDAACGCGPSCCDGGTVPGDAKAASMVMGYSNEDVEGIPEGSQHGAGLRQSPSHCRTESWRYSAGPG